MEQPTQRQLVERACEAWTRRLVDNSRNNSLLFFRQLKVGTLDLTKLRGVSADLLSGKRVNLNQIVAAYRNTFYAEIEDDKVEAEIRRRLVAIQRKALSNAEERGLDTLYLAAGLAT